MEEMKCKKCGQEMSAQTAYCPFCGTPNESPQTPVYNENPAPPPYQHNDPNHMPQSQPSSGMAISSMVLGIISLVLSCLFLGWIPAVISLIQGILALATDKPGKGMAISGIVMSAVTLFFTAFLLIMFMLGIETALY